MLLVSDWFDPDMISASKPLLNRTVQSSGALEAESRREAPEYSTHHRYAKYPVQQGRFTNSRLAAYQDPELSEPRAEISLQQPREDPPMLRRLERLPGSIKSHLKAFEGIAEAQARIGFQNEVNRRVDNGSERFLHWLIDIGQRFPLQVLPLVRLESLRSQFIIRNKG